MIMAMMEKVTLFLLPLLIMLYVTCTLGAAGTDRSNFVAYANLNMNFPIPLVNASYVSLLSTDSSTAAIAARRMAILMNTPQFGGQTSELNDAGFVFTILQHSRSSHLLNP